MRNFKPNDDMTYIHDSLTDENVFINREPENRPLPTYDEVKDRLPQPVWEGHPDALSCYDRTWQLAFSNLRRPQPGSGFVSNYIDTAFNGCLFMWDTSFILMFGKYASRAFNFQHTLDNLYARQHKDGFICREIVESTGCDSFHRHDPSSTGPNVMAWSEWVYYENNGDLARVSEVFPVLLAYHHWLRANRTWPDGSYWSTGWGCGMDNQPRLEPGVNVSFQHGHMVWMDTCMHMVLSAQILQRFAHLLGRDAEVADLAGEEAQLRRFINDELWDDKTAFYYDRWRDGRLNGVKSIGAYWSLLSDLVPADRLDRFLSHLENEKEFNRSHRVPTLSADHPSYRADGGYWCGSVWAPTNYMVMKGLERVGHHDLAYDIACSHLSTVVEVYKKTGTVWENYSPEYAEPGKPAARDFVGWTGLAPISVLFEFVFGIKPDVATRTVEWRIRRTERHGVERYPFGTDTTLDLLCEARADEREEPKVTIHADRPVTVHITWAGGEKTIQA